MEKELYIFSNDPVAPVKGFKEGIDSEYNNLSVYLNPEIAVAPSYSGTPKHNVEEIDRYKEEYPEYDYIHVYKVADSKYDPAMDELETFFYEYSHKERNEQGKREKV